MSVTLALLSSIVVAPGTASAATGDVLKTLAGTPSGSGRAMAFDPVSGHLFYTNAFDPHIYVMDTSGKLIATLATSAPTPINYGALSFESTSNGGVLWGGRYDGSGAVDEINPTTGAISVAFKFSFPAGDSCYSQPSGFIDGLAFDNTDGTLWLSDDASRVIEHVRSDGTLLASYPTPAGQCNSGIAVSVHSLFLGMMAGADTPPYRIVQVAKSAPSSEVSAFDFASANGPEGLALDGRTFPGQCALWANQFNQNTLRAFEVPLSECGGPLGGVYGFGDSIAAGYGLGEADGKNGDNRFAYPAVLAAQLNLPYQNFATAGACALPTDGQSGPPGAGTCRGFEDVQTQINSVAGRIPTPKLITLTVGANDIIFDRCVFAFLQGQAGIPGQDPCASADLRTNLTALQASIAQDLTSLAGDFPGVPVLVTGYFNPFPPPVGANDQPCDLFFPVAVLFALEQGHDIGHIAGALVLHHDQLVSAERSIQNVIYSRTQTIIDELNSTIQRAVEAQGNSTMKFVQLPSFAEHNMCTGSGTSWVFGPSLHGSITVHWFFLSPGFGFDFGPAPYSCPVPSDLELGANLSIQNGPSEHLFIDVEGHALTNCTPHPTDLGQQQIATTLKGHAP